MRSKDTEKRRMWLEKNKEHLREYKKKYYLEHREENKLKNREYSIKYHHRQKIEILSYYSNEDIPYCAVCGDNRLACLSIDHIQGGGNRHRKSIKGNFYSWLKKQGYPEGYQVLCMNCQYIKRVEEGEHRKPIL